MVHVLDDFFIIASLPHKAQSQLQTVLRFYEECGIPIALEKTEGHDQTLAFLSITLEQYKSHSFSSQGVLRCTDQTDGTMAL